RLLGAAAHRVVSVEQVGGSFRGPGAAARTTVPRFLVDTVVELPGGAKPSSCLPFYDTDFTAIRTEVEAATTSRPRTVTASRPKIHLDPETPTPSEMLVCHLARQLRDGAIYTVGSVTPVSMVAYQLAKHTHAP